MRSAWLLCEGNVLASLEVAENVFDRSRGLIGRGAYEGAILLPHTRSVHSFGMRFPLDVAFLDREMVVLGTTRLPPMRAAMPRRHARSVLEAQAGAFERWGLAVGHRLEIRETG